MLPCGGVGVSPCSLFGAFFIWGMFILSPPRASRGLEWGRSSQSRWAVLGPHPCVSLWCLRELGAWRCPRVEAVSVPSLPAGRWSSAQAAAAPVWSHGHSKVSSHCVTSFPCVGARHCRRAPPPSSGWFWVPHPRTRPFEAPSSRAPSPQKPLVALFKSRER